MRICKNTITSELRRLFRANPLRVPESTYQPLSILEIKNKRPRVIGTFPDMVKGIFPPHLEITKHDVAELSGMKSSTARFNLGFDILKGFLEAFGIDAPVIQTTFGNSQKMAFSFNDIQRRKFSPLALGKLLSENNMVGDVDNIFIKKAINDSKTKLAVVTDVIESNNFAIWTYDQNETGIHVDISLIEKYLSKVDLGVKVKSEATNCIQFQRENPMTFAFACVEITIDKETGVFKSGDWLNRLKSRGNESDETSSKEQLDHDAKWLIDEDENDILLVE